MCDYARKSADFSRFSRVKSRKKGLPTPGLSWDFAPEAVRMEAAYVTGGTSLAKTKAKTL